MFDKIMGRITHWISLMISINISSSISRLLRSISMAFSFISMYSSDFLDPLSNFKLRITSRLLDSIFFTYTLFTPLTLSPNR